MLLFNGGSVSIALGYVVSNGFWFLVINVVSKFCFSVLFTFCLFSFCVNIYLLFRPSFDYNYRLVSSTFSAVFTVDLNV